MEGTLEEHQQGIFLTDRKRREQGVINQMERVYLGHGEWSYRLKYSSKFSGEKSLKSAVEFDNRRRLESVAHV